VIPARLLNRTLTWVQPATVTDAYGDAAKSFAAEDVTETTIAGRIEQSSTRETNDETRDLSTSALVLYTNTAGISPADRIVDGATVYEVTGIVADVDGPAGRHHCEARLRLLDGS
jgi:glycine/D-amino acid oxidase-like deaminating enzyme